MYALYYQKHLQPYYPEQSLWKLLDESLNDNVIDQLSLLSPRTIKIAIEESAFRAIRNQRGTIYPSDLPIFKK